MNAEKYETGKGISTKHTSQCLRKAGEDEPIFVLRAKDPTAPQVIVKWVAENIGVQPFEKLQGALALAHEMQEWRESYFKD